MSSTELAHEDLAQLDRGEYKTKFDPYTDNSIQND